MVAVGNWERRARSKGVARRLSPMPAKEITKIFIAAFSADCPLFGSSLAPAEAIHPGAHVSGIGWKKFVAHILPDGPLRFLLDSFQGGLAFRFGEIFLRH